MQRQYRTDYWGDAEARAVFRAWLRGMHGLDLTEWDERGCWPDHYRPFTWFGADGRILSSVQVYSLQLVVAGAPLRAAQLSGVGTDPAYRRRGWNRELTERALEWAAPDHDWVFLFADEDAVPYYRALGFEPARERAPVLDVGTRASGDPGRALDLGRADDWDFLARRARDRTPVSEVCGVLDAELFLCHALNSSATLHHHEELDLVLFAERDGGRFVVHDVLGGAFPSIDEFVARAVPDGAREVAFSFVPDRFGLGADDVRWEPVPDSGLHTLGGSPFGDRPFLMPRTAHA